MCSHKTKVLITIDTEFSIGGYFKNKRNKPVPADRHIYCKIKGKDYGINLIMDILEKYELKGIFFVETESRFYFGEEEVLNIIQNIKTRGHEVQLHIHPTYNTFAKGRIVSDDMRKYSTEEQTNIIAKALEFLASHGIKDILAFRSGGFYSDLNTIKALRKNGLKYSSNYNIACPNCSYIENKQPRNDIYPLDHIFEIPVTCYKEFPIRKDWNSFQISACSFDEFKSALAYYHDNQVQLTTLITHSFEFVKSKDIQFSKIAPKQIMIKRFENICNYLVSYPDKFRVITYEELDMLIQQNKISIKNKVGDFYRSTFLKTFTRYTQNAISRFAHSPL